jgi:type I restriction-modification system DNA methylase subunit
VEKDGLMTTTGDIVAKLWSLCHVLRDDGVTYNEYVTELTFLLFLKMLEETTKENRLPKAYRWRELAKRDGLDQLDYYKRLLLDLGNGKRRRNELRMAGPTKTMPLSSGHMDWHWPRWN